MEKHNGQTAKKHQHLQACRRGWRIAHDRVPGIEQPGGGQRSGPVKNPEAAGKI